MCNARMTNPKEYRHSPKHVQRVSYEERERAKKHGARWNKPLGTRVLSTREPLRGWVARRSAAAAAMSVGAGEARTTRVIDMRRASRRQTPPMRELLIVFEACLFVAHLGVTAYLLAHWSKLGSASNAHFVSFNAVALLSFHYCVITPLLLMPATDRRTRAGFSLTALAWAYSLSLGLCSAIALHAPVFAAVLIGLSILQSLLVAAYFLL